MPGIGKGSWPHSVPEACCAAKSQSEQASPGGPGKDGAGAREANS